MLVTNNTNFSNRNVQPAFGAIKYDMAKDTLRTVLSLKELRQFKEMVKTYDTFNNADLILFGDKKKISAKITDTLELKDCKITNHSPRIFEGKMHFIKRMAKKMKERHYEVIDLLAKQNFKFEN